MSKATVNQKAVKDELWRRGNLRFKLDDNQKEMYDLFYNKTFKKNVWLLARRNGKSYTLCVLALEQCFRKPNSIVKFVSPTKLQVNNIVRPLFRLLLEDCPEDIKPTLREKDYVYFFPNGSEIQLAGTDNGHCEKLRGGDSHIAIVDEAGSCSSLDYVVKSILLPTTLTTKGKVILAGTPPEEADHDFIKFCEEAEEDGSIVKKTIYDNPRVTKEMIQEMIRESGGENSSAWKREYLCMFIKDERSSVLPEVTEELLAKIVKEWPRPPHYDTYESMDWGGRDLTCVLFGYYDFRADKIIIEDELFYEEKDFSIPKLAEDIEKKEKALWYNIYTNEIKSPNKRISDINFIATNDLRRHTNGKLNFTHIERDDKDSSVKVLRMMLQQGKIIIHPRCKKLIHQLKTARWKKSTTVNVFARTETDGHFDLVDACIYLVKNISYERNPYPHGYDMNMKDLFIRNPEGFYSSDKTAVYRKIFGLKKR